MADKASTLSEVAALLKRVYGESLSNVESLGRGAVAAVPGVFGDLESIFRDDKARRLATTEEILRDRMPRRLTKPTEEASGFESIGTYIPPPSVVSALSAIKRATAPARLVGGRSGAIPMREFERNVSRMKVPEGDRILFHSTDIPWEGNTPKPNTWFSDVAPTADNPFGQTVRVYSVPSDVAVSKPLQRGRTFYEDLAALKEPIAAVDEGGGQISYVVRDPSVLQRLKLQKDFPRPLNRQIGAINPEDARLGELVDRYVRKVRKMSDLGPAEYSIHKVEAPSSFDVPGWHITQDIQGILRSGAMTNRNVGSNNLQGWVPSHVGGAYFYSDPRLARAKWEDFAAMLGDDALAAELPIIRAQLRRGNRLVPDEDVGLNVPWQQSYQEGSFATTRPVLIDQIDRIYSADPDITKDMIRDTVIRKRRYAKGGLAQLKECSCHG